MSVWSVILSVMMFHFGIVPLIVVVFLTVRWSVLYLVPLSLCTISLFIYGSQYICGVDCVLMVSFTDKLDNIMCDHIE